MTRFLLRALSALVALVMVGGPIARTADVEPAAGSPVVADHTRVLSTQATPGAPGSRAPPAF